MKSTSYSCTIDDLDHFPDDGKLREIVAGQVVEWDVQKKIHDWLRSGVRLLWYIDPTSGTTAIYSGDHLTYVNAEDALEGSDVLPGLSLRVQDIYDELAEIDVLAASDG